MEQNICGRAKKVSELPPQKVDLVVIGAGPAGLAAAISAKKSGLQNLIVVERNGWLGGILPQCIHDGFGLELFKEQMTGPEYALRYVDELKVLKIPYMLDSMVLEVTPEKKVYVASPKGLFCFDAKAIVLAMGCRERTRGQICIPGTRPAGVYTAGVAQNLINLKNVMVGKDVVILGSGDIGLIMARRLTLEGAKVHAVVEILPHTNGLPRNIQQCLIDYDIPLLLSHTVTEIHGQNRVEAVTISPVGKDLKPIKGKEQKLTCDTLMLSIGLIPENDLSKNFGVKLSEVTGGAIVDENLETSISGVFACGNVLHVHDVVDFVTLEAEKAGRSAANYVLGKVQRGKRIPIEAGEKIRYVLPQSICRGVDLELSIRVTCPGEDVTIGFFDKETQFKTVKFRKVHPAQMIKIKLKENETRDIKSLKVEVLEK
ncbi:MAG: NAD(P)/FAD-dependent oxidoreductase [Candidatus Bathyarchaeota archaeon]|nr:NAD(P)/FAD-dependent oxidoreductase [Candidatus Bathyarchaeota archaeon]